MRIAFPGVHVLVVLLAAICGGAGMRSARAQNSPSVPVPVPAASPATAPVANPPSSPRGVTVPPYVVDVRRLKQGLDTGFEVVVGGLHPSLEGQRPEDQDRWVLFFDGEPVPKLLPAVVTQAATAAGPATTIFRFAFKHEAVDRPAWRDLFSKAGFFRSSAISLGPPGAPPAVTPLLVPFKRLMVPWERFTGIAVFMALLTTILWILGFRTPLLRDGDSYSLGRSQMAFWFLVIVGAYLFIGVVMGTWTGTIGGQALSLMGISSATGLAAAAINAEKRKAAIATAAAPEALAAHRQALEKTITENAGTPNVPLLVPQLSDATVDLAKALKAQAAAAANTTAHGSSGFWKDIVSDADGVAMHRFQIVTWTIVLGAIFLMRVIVDLTMPELDPTLLTLLGISSGTYLGFKFPEKS